MTRFRPLTSRLVSRLLGRSIADGATRAVTIAPPSDVPNPPAISLPDERDRILGHHPLSVPETNWSWLDDATIHQGATRAHLLRDIVIADGTLLSATAYAAIRSQKRRMRVPSGLPAIAEATFCSTFVTERYFAHFLMDGLSSELLARDQQWRALMLAGTEYGHEAGYREAAGLPGERVALARVDRLWLLEDCEVNANRTARLNLLRDTVRGDATGRSRNVFISRGTLGVGRVMGNEAEVVEALSKREFDILFPEQTDPADIIERLRSARIVVAVEGSAIAHAIISAPRGAGVMVIQPPRSLNMCYRIYAAAVGLTFGYTVGEPTSEETFSQPIDRLNRAIDLLDGALA